MAEKKPFIYTLSTCIHCRHLKEYLKECGIEFNYIDVDQLTGDERKKTIEAIKKLNPSVSFPTILLDGGDTVLVGFKKKDLQRALGIS
jgi:glutaredoxin-like protein NrdH